MELKYMQNSLAKYLNPLITLNDKILGIIKFKQFKPFSAPIK